jgi:hypothetical protein
MAKVTCCIPLQALHNRMLAQRLRERAASDVPVGGLGREEAWTAAESKAKQLEAGAAKTLQEAEACVLDHAQVGGTNCTCHWAFDGLAACSIEAVLCASSD